MWSTVLVYGVLRLLITLLVSLRPPIIVLGWSLTAIPELIARCTVVAHQNGSRRGRQSTMEQAKNSQQLVFFAR